MRDETAEQEAVATWPFGDHSTRWPKIFRWSLSQRPGRYRLLFCSEWSTSRSGKMPSNGASIHLTHYPRKAGLVTASPPDVRRRLCPAVHLAVFTGLGPWCGLRPLDWRVFFRLNDPEVVIAHLRDFSNEMADKAHLRAKPTPWAQPDL